MVIDCDIQRKLVLLVVVDQFSKWVECYALSDQTAERVARTLVSLGDLGALMSCTVIRVVTLRVGCSKKCVTY